MNPDILIIYDNEGYHLLHGHLLLAALLGASEKAAVEVKGHGTVLISRRRGGLVVEAMGKSVPLITE